MQDHLVLALGLGSAMALAMVNVLIKSGGDILLARSQMSLMAALIALPFTLFFPGIPPEYWGFMLASILAHWVYQFALIRALHRGDLSLVFPVMRGLAPVLTSLAAFFLLDESLSPIAIGGLVMASLALIVFGLSDGKRDKTGQSLRSSALFWAIATAIGVALYSVVDADGVRRVPSAISYTLWLFVFDALGVNSVAIVMQRQNYLDYLSRFWRKGFMSGALCLISYGFALQAFAMAPASYVSALRETGIVFAALMGWLILKEGFGARRIAAAALVVLGLAGLHIGELSGSST